MMTEPILDNYRLRDDATPNQAADFLIRVSGALVTARDQNPDLSGDFVRALVAISQNPEALIFEVEDAGTSIWRPVSFAHDLLKIFDKLELSPAQLCQVRDSALVGAAHDSLGAERSWFCSGSSESNVAGSLALLAVKATKLLSQLPLIGEEDGQITIE